MTDEYQRSGAIARFPDMAKAATVVYADPGSAAEQSGIRPDDLVVSVNDSPIPADARAQAVLTAVFAQSGKTPARVTLKRAGQNVTVTVPGALACSYPIEAVDSDKINSYTDATGIYINKGMIALLHSDDELAVILGHEMGHNISGQIEAGLGSHIELALGGKAAIIPLEEEADYVGLYAMARAGYEINAAPALWRRLAAVVMPEAITEASDHPIFPVRVVMLKKEIAEINAKVARGAALLPETGGASGVAPVAAAVGGR
jgi:predicted Zn-dependent protease